MRPERARALTLAFAALLACCHSEPPPSQPPASAVVSPCRVGPDGAPIRADRGIGGTGGPTRQADRGIGGTGGPATNTGVADRGIGGTGIIGVITGFASVCLAGQEVALPPDVAVAIDRLPASQGVLRAGQVAVIDAAAGPAGLQARRIVIRYEVVGPVERVDGDRIRVAGQDVALSPQTWGTRPARGDFVAVSGLRRANAVIEATRVEPQSTGPVLIHGKLVEQDGALRIGALPIQRDRATVALVGSEVTVAGMVGPNGALLPFSVTADLLVIDPAAYFGPSIGVVLIESFAVLDGGRLRLAPGFSAPTQGLRLEGSQRGVFRFERGDGGLRATSFANPPAGIVAPHFEPAPRFEPAPVPNRAIGGPGLDRPARNGPGSRGDGHQGRFGRDRSDGALGLAPPGNLPPRGR